MVATLQVGQPTKTTTDCTHSSFEIPEQTQYKAEGLFKLISKWRENGNKIRISLAEILY